MEWIVYVAVFIAGWWARDAYSYYILRQEMIRAVRSLKNNNINNVTIELKL